MNTIHLASSSNSLDFFTSTELSIKSLHIPGGINKSSPLQYAVYNDNHKIILFLLLNDVDTEYKNTKNKDAFYIIYKFDYVLTYLLFKYFNKTDSRTRKGKRILLLYYRYVDYNMVYINKYTLILKILLYPNRIKRSPYFLYLNILYSIEIFDRFSIISVLYLIILIYLITYKESNRKKENDLIIDLILNDKYDLHTFCYICQDIKRYHCSYCDRCLVDKHHHCIFLNNCVLNKNILIFYLYIMIYLIKLMHSIYKEEGTLRRIEYSVITLILLIK
jgi:hypothetical protein